MGMNQLVIVTSTVHMATRHVPEAYLVIHDLDEDGMEISYRDDAQTGNSWLLFLLAIVSALTTE